MPRPCTQERIALADALCSTALPHRAQLSSSFGSWTRRNYRAMRIVFSHRGGGWGRAFPATPFFLRGAPFSFVFVKDLACDAPVSKSVPAQSRRKDEFSRYCMRVRSCVEISGRQTSL